MRRLTAVLASLLAVACVGDPPALHESAIAAPSPAAVAAATPAPSATEPPPGAAWQRLAQQLEQENARLQAQVADANQQAALARADTERYRQGLERAVAELNRLGAARAAEAARHAAVEEIHARVHAARVHALGSPRPQLLGDEVLVTGTLWNAGDADAQGSITIELLLDGRPVGSRDVPMTVPARTETPYSASFRIDSNDTGTYAGRVSLRF